MKKDNKTIGVVVRFFTNDLPERIGRKRGQTPFWTAGNVHLEANNAKGIKSQNELFHYMEDIPRAIKEVLRRSKLSPVINLNYSLRAEKRHK